MYLHPWYLAKLSLTEGDWLVILGIHALVIAVLVKMVEKLTDAKLKRAKDVQERETLWEAGCNGKLVCLADLVLALSRQSAYLTALVRMTIEECRLSAAFPEIARVNRSVQEVVDKAAAELNLFSAEVTQRQAAAQILAHQLGDLCSLNCMDAAGKLYPDDVELKQCLKFLSHRIQYIP